MQHALRNHAYIHTDKSFIQPYIDNAFSLKAMCNKKKKEGIIFFFCLN